MLLAILTVFWGFNWTVLKFGVLELPPVWFRLLGLAGGTALIGIYARVTGVSLAVPTGNWWRIFGLALPNITLWMLLGIYSIALLPSGRAAILGYTMPIWAAVIGVIFYGERPGMRTWFGVACAGAATLLLVAGEFDAMRGSPLGTGLMLLAAVLWGWGTHLLRRSPLKMNTVALTFWMLAMSVVVLLVFSALVEFDRWTLPVGSQWWPILYNAVFVLALCNVIWFSLARSMHPVASGLSGMLIPVVGVFSGLIVLGEVPHWRDELALVLILVALATTVWSSAPGAAR